MALSEREQRLLDELERGLYASDANLAQKLNRPLSVSPRKIVAGLALALIGLSLLIVAVTIQIVAFGVVGFLIMLAGLVLASSGQSRKSPLATTSKPTGTKRANKNSFQDRWDRRQGQ